MEQRKISAEIEARGTGEDMEFVISTASVDRHGTVLDPNGWNLDNFNRNPIMAYQHNTNSTDPDDIIGTWELRVEGGQLIGKPKFEPEEINPKAEKIRRKIEHGTIRAVSVGFIPQEYRWGQKSRGEDVDVLYLEKNELLEVSVVAVPSNPDALKRSVEDIKKEFPKPMEEKVNLDVERGRVFINRFKMNL
jgi:HK97 family phage prohead protease